MAYATNDKSTAKGRPVHFYKFTGDFGVYRYNNTDKSEVCDGEIYLPVKGGVSNSPIELTSSSDAAVTCDISVPVDTPVAKSICFTETPNVWEVEIRRAHRGDDMNTDWTLEWWGFGLGSTVNAGYGVLSTGSALQQFFGRVMPGITYKRSCNHKLYDARCGLNKNDWTVKTIVRRVQNTLITFDETHIADNDFARGYAECSRTGEKRPIFSSTGETVRVAYGFFDLQPGDELQLVFGCDHKRLGDCKQRFNNVHRYGGFDSIPLANPFADLNYNTVTSTTTREDRNKTAQTTTTYNDLGNVGSTTSGGGSGNTKSYSLYPPKMQTTSTKTYKSGNSKTVTSKDPTSIQGSNLKSEVGGVVPYVAGRRRLAGSNIIAFGKAEAIYKTQVTTDSNTTTEPAETQTSSGAGQSSSTTTTTEVVTTKTTVVKTPIGFTTDILLALCLGPNVRLREIWSGKEKLWDGNIGPAQTQFVIPQNPYGLGGLNCTFSGGAFDQPGPPGFNPDPGDDNGRKGDFTSGVQLILRMPTDDQKIKHRTLFGWWSGQPLPANSSAVVYPSTPGGMGEWPVPGGGLPILDGVQIVAMWSTFQTLVFTDASTYIQSVLVTKGDTRVTKPTMVMHTSLGLAVPMVAQEYFPAQDVTFYYASPNLPMITNVGDATVYGYNNDDIKKPNFAGIAYLYIRGIRGDIGLADVTFEVERYPDAPVGGVAVNDNDLNVARAMYDVLTNEWGGMGIDPAYIGESFSDAGWYFADHFGYGSVLVDSKMAGSEVIKLLEQQTMSKVYSDYRTRKIQIRTPGNSVLNGAATLNLTQFNISAFRSLSKKSWGEVVANLTVTYPRRAIQYEPDIVSAAGAELPSQVVKGADLEIGLPYVCRQDVAAYVVGHVMSQLFIPSFKGEVTANREAAGLVPGELSILNYDRYGLLSVPVEIEKIRKNPLNENTVEVTFTQWVKPDGDNITVFIPDQPEEVSWEYMPLAPTNLVLEAAPFHFVRMMGLVNFNTLSDASYPMLMPTPANELQMSYSVSMKAPADAQAETIRINAIYPMCAELVAPISKYEGWADGYLPELEVAGVVNARDAVDQTNVFREGRQLLVINDEMFTFEKLEILPAMRAKFTGLHRAAVDTVAQDHGVSSKVFVIDNIYSNISGKPMANPVPYQPEWEIVSNSIVANGNPDNDNHTLTYVGYSPKARRSIAPPRPHRTSINGIRSAERVELHEGAVISWATRSRADVTIPTQTDPADKSEVYMDDGEQVFQSHRVYVRDRTDAVYKVAETANDVDGIVSAVVALPPAMRGGEGVLFVRSVVRDWESVYDDELLVNVIQEVNYRITEDGQFRETEAGEQRDT